MSDEERTQVRERIEKKVNEDFAVFENMTHPATFKAIKRRAFHLAILEYYAGRLAVIDEKIKKGTGEG